MDIKEIIEKYKPIFDYSIDELHITDGEGKILYINAACGRHYGKEASWFIGQPATRAEEEGVVDHCITPLVIKEKKKVTIIQKTNIGRELLITGNPVFDESGNIQLIISNVRDISEISDLKNRLAETETLVQRYSDELEILREKEFNFEGIVVNSEKFKYILKMVKRIATTDSTIMITGESGTGKDQVAKIIHSSSNRSKGPFIKVNCGAIPSALIESELFGYEGGAFTGSKKSGKAGLMELANDGTLFLDEITELPYDVQVKLLQALQDFEFTKIGGSRCIKTDFRLIAATNRNITEYVKENKFREDLYYRLYVVPIEIPPLRERKEEIFPLLQYYLNHFNQKYNLNKSFTSRAVSSLEAYNWPGNIRELKNIVERLVVTCAKDRLTVETVLTTLGENPQDSQITTGKTLPEMVEEFENKIIQICYKESGSSYKVAKRLGISQRTALRKIQKCLKIEATSAISNTF